MRAHFLDQHREDDVLAFVGRSGREPLGHVAPGVAAAADNVGKGRRCQARQEISGRVPPHRRVVHHGLAAVPERGQRVEGLTRRDRVRREAPRQGIARFGMARQIAGVGDRAPADHHRRQALTAPPPRHAFDRRVRRDVASLTRGAERGGRRRVKHEQLDRIVARRAVQIIGAAELRRHHPVETESVEIGQQRVVDRHRGMDDAPERRHGMADRGERLVQRGGIGDVARKRAGIDARCHQPHHRLGRAGRRGAAPAQQRQRPRPLACQPLGGGKAEARQAAGDEIRAVAMNGEAGRLDRRA